MLCGAGDGDEGDVGDGTGDVDGAAEGAAVSGISMGSAMPSSRKRKAFLQVVQRTARPTSTGLRG